MATLPPNFLVSKDGCLDTHFLYKSWVLGSLDSLCNVNFWLNRGQDINQAMEITRNFLEIYEVIRDGVCGTMTLPVGTIISSLNNSAPSGFLPLNGGSFPVSQYEDLASVLPQWVSDGFINLPNMAGRSLVGNGLFQGMDYQQNFVATQIGGDAQHKLTVTELPQHNHNAPVSSPLLTASAILATGNAQTGTGFGAVANTSGTRWQVTPMTSVGGGQNHNNMPPHLVVYWYIKW